MGRHDRAWTGLQILIVGTTPALPMEIEQAFAEASPGNELRVSSFEHYEQAYDYAKASHDVGFLVVLEQCGDLPAPQVFHELAKHYEVRGMPCFGVLAHEKGETLTGWRAMKADSRLVDYVAAADLAKHETVAAMLDQLWERFNAAFENALLPLPLQESLRAVAAGTVGAACLETYDRTITALGSEMNISWLEQFAVRWSLVRDAIKQSGNPVLDCHPHLCTLIDTAAVPEDLKGRAIEETIRAKQELPVRLAAVARNLALMPAETLSAELDRVTPLAKPGAPAMLRHLVRLKARIVEFQADSRSGNYKAI